MAEGLEVPDDPNLVMRPRSILRATAQAVFLGMGIYADVLRKRLVARWLALKENNSVLGTLVDALKVWLTRACRVPMASILVSAGAKRRGEGEGEGGEGSRLSCCFPL